MKMRIPTNKEYDKLVELTGGNYEKMHWDYIFSWVNDIENKYGLPTARRVRRGYGSARFWSHASMSYRSVDLGFRPAIDYLAPDTLPSDIKEGDFINVGTLYMDGNPVKVSQTPAGNGDIADYTPGAKLEMRETLGDAAYQVTGIYIGNGVVIADRVILNYISYQDLEMNITTHLLMRDMVESGYEKGVIKLINSPNGDGIVCQIGDNWFYFCGTTAEEYDDPQAFATDIPKADIINSIYDTLEEFSQSKEFFDEFSYYVTVLTERLKLPIPADIFEYEETIIAYVDNGPKDKVALGIVVKVIVPDLDVISAIRSAAKEFCETPEGKEYLAGSSNRLNYGDFIEIYPEELCKKHGFCIVDTFTTDLIVSHDENLAFKINE